jgi:hypothetical protein
MSATVSAESQSVPTQLNDLLDLNDKSKSTSSNAKVSVQLSADGLNFFDWQSAVIEVAVVKNVHKPLFEEKPKTVDDIMCMGSMVGSVPDAIGSRLRAQKTACAAFKWVTSQFQGGENQKINEL